MENGHLCPECGTERAAPDGNRPGPGAPACDCARRAAEAHHADRTAEIADAEDFNPLRIRPYVNLARPEEEAEGSKGSPTEPTAPPAFQEQGPGSETRGAGSRIPGSGSQQPRPEGAAHPAAQTMPLRAIPATAAPYDAYGYDDASGTGPQGHGGDPAPHADAPPAARRSRTVLLAAAAAVVVVAGAAFATGAFDSDSDEPLALPAVSTSTPAPVTEPATASAPSPTKASPSATATHTARPTPARTTRSATPTRTPVSSPSKRPTPTATTPAIRPTTPKPPVSPVSTVPPGSLAQGSSGPEVRELQDRLSQEWLYNGPANGQYTSRVTDAVARFQSYMDIEEDPEGVYGPTTRAALEGRTREP